MIITIDNSVFISITLLLRAVICRLLILLSHMHEAILFTLKKKGLYHNCLQPSGTTHQM